MQSQDKEDDGVELEEEESDQETGQPGAAEAAVRQAEAEGLTLQPSDNATGYRCVRNNCHSLARPFYARVWRAGKHVCLGRFATAEEAALAYARTPEAQAQVAKPTPLTAEEAVAQAGAEGLTLERSSNAAGYTGVSVYGSRYQAYVMRAGKKVHLGTFDTAEEAALAVARFDARTDPPAAAPAAAPATAPAAAKRAAPPPRPSPAEQSRDSAAPGPLQPNPDPEDGTNVEVIEVVDEEDADGEEGEEEEEGGNDDEVVGQSGAAAAAVRQAEAEGLTLQSSDNSTGFRGVFKESRPGRAKPFRANMWRAGKTVHLGRFLTAEEAALALARFDARTDPPAAAPTAAQRAAPPPPKPPPAKPRPKANSEEPAAAPSPASTSAASVWLEVGQSVEACFGRRGYWFPGVVQHINEDGTLAIDYDDGDQEERVLRKHVRPPKAKARPPSPLASTSSGRLRTAPQRLDASLLGASSRSCTSAGEASTLEEEEDSDEEESDEGSDEELGAPATLTADAVDLSGAAAAAVRQAEAEGLTLQPSDNATGFRGVRNNCHSLAKPFRAYVWRAGKEANLGSFASAEEAALAVARADARTDPPAAAPAAAKRAAPPPPKPPPAKQPRHTPQPCPVQPVPPPQRDTAAPQASPKLEAAAAAPAPMIFKDKLALLKRELEIAPATPAIPAVAEANQLMGITPGLGESLGVQLDRLLGIIS